MNEVIIEFVLINISSSSSIEKETRAIPIEFICTGKEEEEEEEENSS